MGDESTTVALTENALGELYINMARLDEALVLLEHAERIRGADDNFDTASTRDNIGRVWEMKGDMVKAREAREKGAPDHMICSNFYCPSSSVNTLYKRSQLQACSRCKCIFYCKRSCQVADWKKKHKHYCKAPAP